jgi:hypothetical protein
MFEQKTAWCLYVSRKDDSQGPWIILHIIPDVTQKEAVDYVLDKMEIRDIGNVKSILVGKVNDMFEADNTKLHRLQKCIG